MDNNRQKIIVIVGPTSSGKSDLGIMLARKFNGEIISADSRQVYRGMNIGTGKVTKKEQRMVRHHLLDVASPKNIFTAGEFKRLGQKVLSDIAKRTKTPIIVGGTGFYIDAMLERASLAEVPPNPKLRARFDKLTVKKLFEKLKKSDPARAAAIDRHNKRRLIRALEIIDALGKVPRPPTRTPQVRILWLGLKPGDLDKKIGIRLDKRLRKGMMREIKKLREKGVSWKRFYAFGLEYRWVSLYLRGKLTYKEMRNGLLRDIIKYSKRQMTWFKRNKEIHWLKNQKQAVRLVRDFLRT